MIRYFIGPMSKNIVDVLLNYKNKKYFGFIPSRRQIEYNGGYVNNWTTENFSKYVNNKLTIERDHAGLGQGYKYDNGFKSLQYDTKYFGIIHIDPWKEIKNLYDGIDKTIEYINYCYNLNSNVKFEIGTEEKIRKFSLYDFEVLIRTIKEKLNYNVFNNIEYAVIQSGVNINLSTMKNDGQFNLDRLKSMINICKKYNLKSKEHNGDYLNNKEYKIRFENNLDAINIAPEFGQMETICYLEEIEDNVETYYKICYDSGRWKKWVDSNFKPDKNKKELIKICGHYILSEENFKKIKPNINKKIKLKIEEKLNKLINYV